MHGFKILINFFRWRVWEATVAAKALTTAEATEVWERTMVVEVLGSSGGLPCKALQRLELEILCMQHHHPMISSEPLISLSFSPTNKNKQKQLLLSLSPIPSYSLFSFRLTDSTIVRPCSLAMTYSFSRV